MRRYRSGEFKAGTKARGPLKERFWAKVGKRGADECWLWTGNTQATGYGRIQECGKRGATISAHRYSYELHNGLNYIPYGMVVMHTCDVPGCVNPAHLKLGTYQENMDDMWSKGRGKPVAPKGSANGKSKLTEELVRYIRANPQRSHTDLARELGLSPNAIRGVRIGRTWTYVK